MEDAEWDWKPDHVTAVDIDSIHPEHRSTRYG
jgi:hypothetical protein